MSHNDSAAPQLNRGGKIKPFTLGQLNALAIVFFLAVLLVIVLNDPGNPWWPSAKHLSSTFRTLGVTASVMLALIMVANDRHNAGHWFIRCGLLALGVFYATECVVGF